MAGDARGRRLIAPAGDGTRPTLDRVREAMFNALASLGAIEGVEVLDLFAGSGALGIEALSRGAALATFVDRDRAARRAIETNLASTGLADRATVVSMRAEDFLVRSGPTGSGEQGRSFSLVLLDPPYGSDDEAWRALLEALSSRSDIAHVVIESDREIAVDDRWDVVREKWYGGTLLVILRPSTPSRPAPDRSAEPT